MANKYKTAKKCKIDPWLSARLDCSEGRFIQVGNSLFLSRKDEETGAEKNVFLQLNSGARFLYLCMTLEAGGRRDFVFPLKASKKYGLSETTFRRGVSALIEKGLITKKSGKTVRLPNLYQFSFNWKTNISG